MTERRGGNAPDDPRGADPGDERAPSRRSGEGGGREAGRHSPGPPDLPPRETPWIETRAGELFFVNALLVSPELVVLLPLVVGVVLRSLGLLQGPSRFIDTIPRVAAYVLPWVGWVLVVPLWTTVKNLRMEGVGTWPRRALWGMGALHVLFLAYTAWRWVVG